MIEEPRVLIACPVCEGKGYSIKVWLEWICEQHYKNVDALVCVNGVKAPEYQKSLSTWKYQTRYGKIKPLLSINLPESEDISLFQKIGYSREMIRRYAIKNNYTHLLFLDSDTIPLLKDTIKQLVKSEKEWISGVYYYKGTMKPVFNSLEMRGLHFNDIFGEIKKDINKQLEIHSGGYGCVMLSGKALETPFLYNKYKENLGEDIAHCREVEKQGIKRYLYLKLLCKHLQDKHHVNFIGD